MGIDMYLRWDDQTEEEKQAQYTGFAIDAGHTGYLREAYHGGPYATQVLAPECWEESVWNGNGSDEPPEGAFIIAENRGYIDRGVPEGRPTIPAETLPDRMERAVRASWERYQGEPRAQEMAVKSVRDFVGLAMLKLSEGKRVWIYCSY